MTEDAASDEAPVTFNIKYGNDNRHSLTLPLTATVLELKQKLATPEYVNFEPGRQRLIYSGRVLKDADTLASYKIKEGNTVHLVQAAAPSANTGVNSAPSNVPANLAAGTGNNPLAGLTGARYAGFAQLPNQNMFGPDGGMGPPPDPEQMITMLENPQFASTLNEALQNPSLIDMMIQQNPMLRNMGPEVREMLQTPEFRRMMTDPEQMRQVSQMQRMLGGMGGGMGGGAAAAAFPAPGVTDTTPVQENNGGNARTGQPARPPFNIMGMLGNPAAAGGQAANNPFLAFMNPAAAGNATPSSTVPSSNTAGNAGTAAAPADGQPNPPQQQQQQQQQPPFNPFLHNPALLPQLLQAMGGGGGASSTQATASSANNNPNPNPWAALLGGPGGMAAFGGQQQQQQPFGGLGLGGGLANPVAPPVDTRPPEERYAEQLRQLNDMGFYGFERNVEALRRTGGSVQGAVDYLLGGEGR